VRRLTALALIAAIVVAAACHDTTRPRRQSPLVGTWELTTHFDTFVFETPGASPPDCPNATQYCVHFSSNTGGPYLGGILEVQDTSSSADTLGSSTVVIAGMLQSSFCDAAGSYPPIGCTHVSARVPVQYAGNMTVTQDGTTAGSIWLWLSEPYVGSWPNPRILGSGPLTYAGDSIDGRVPHWGTIQGRSPPTYRGTVVLRRVH